MGKSDAEILEEKLKTKRAALPPPPERKAKIKAREWTPIPEPTPEQVAEKERIHELEKKREEMYRRQREWNMIALKVGKRYAGCRISNYVVQGGAQRAVLESLAKYTDDMRKNIDGGNGLILFGKQGTGKDHLMVAAMRLAVLRAGASVVWINCLEWYGKLRDSIGNNTTEAEIVRELSRPDVLALSDPLPIVGGEQTGLTRYQADFLYRVVDERCRNLRPTWVTVNGDDGEEIGGRMGAVTWDRMRDGALPLFFDWESYRKTLLQKVAN